MAKRAYIGVGNVARKVKKIYIGIGGVARKVKKAYIGIGGVARPWWSGGPQYYGYITPLSGDQYDTLAASTDDYAVFHGGRVSTADAYDVELTRTAVSLTRHSEGAATAVGNCALFADGYLTGSYRRSVRGVTNDLTTIGSSLNYGRGYLSAVTVDDYALFCGGKVDWDDGEDYGTDYYNQVEAINSNMVRTDAPNLSVARYSSMATRAGNFALVAGGGGKSGVSSVVEAYSADLTKTTAPNLSVARQGGGATTLNNAALICGGYPSAGYKTVDVYDENLTKTTATSLDNFNTPRISAGTLGDFAIVIGNVIYLYDDNLTRSVLETSIEGSLTVGAITSVGNFALVGGERCSSTGGSGGSSELVYAITI